MKDTDAEAAAAWNTRAALQAPVVGGGEIEALADRALAIDCFQGRVTVSFDDDETAREFFDRLTEWPAPSSSVQPDGLRVALEKARSAIASLGEFDLGGVEVNDTHTGEVTGQYGIRDELLSNIDAALSKPQAVPEGCSFAALRDANTARQKEWDAGNQISLTYRATELAGELGEACNIIKKLERERLGIRGSRDTVEHLAEELADIVICTDLIAMSEGIDLQRAVVEKFNATSEKVGLETRLPSPPSQGRQP